MCQVFFFVQGPTPRLTGGLVGTHGRSCSLTRHPGACSAPWAEIPIPRDVARTETNPGGQQAQVLQAPQQQVIQPQQLLPPLQVPTMNHGTIQQTIQQMEEDAKKRIGIMVLWRRIRETGMEVA